MRNGMWYEPNREEHNCAICLPMQMVHNQLNTPPHRNFCSNANIFNYILMSIFSKIAMNIFWLKLLPFELLNLISISMWWKCVLREWIFVFCSLRNVVTVFQLLSSKGLLLAMKSIQQYCSLSLTFDSLLRNETL